MKFQHGAPPADGGKARDKFWVYASRSVRPSLPVLLLLALCPLASASSLLALSSREDQLAKVAGRASVSFFVAGTN